MSNLNTCGKLSVSLIQTDLCWQAPEDNRAQLQPQLAALAGNTDLAVLPEMFATGFSMAPEVAAETEQGETLAWLRQQAQTLNIAICGSLAIAIEGQDKVEYVNRFYFVTPDGALESYDKRHLFRMGGEHNHYRPGVERKVIHYRGWRILPQICYDLRFPVFARNRNDYDLAIYVANWPEVRRLPWRTLLQARAIENQCFVAGVNRVGRDGMELDYCGDSMLIDFKGLPQIDREPGVAFTATTTLSLDELSAFREKFPAWQDSDAFELVDGH